MAYLSYQEPTAYEHPRCVVRSGHDRSLYWIKDRCLSTSPYTGTYASYYNSLLSYCSQYSGNTIDSFISRQWEFIAAYAFAYLVSGNTTYADIAINICYQLSQTPIPSSVTTKRFQLLAMALTYDWCYSRLSSGGKAYFREDAPYSIYTRIQNIVTMSPTEYMWGHSSENNPVAIAAIGAVINDFNSSTKETNITSWLETALDNWENGTDTACINATFSYFGDSDGGTMKGAGSFSYLQRWEQFMLIAFPMWETAFGLDPWTISPWWKNTIDWHIWHWRGDRSLGHNQNDGMRMAQYSTETQAHAWQIAQKYSDALANRAAWLAREIESVNNWSFWGPYHIHNCLWRENARNPSSIKPTTTGSGIATTGTSDMKVFSPAQKIVVRDTWETTGFSSTLSGQRYTGGHSHRDAGHIEICYNGTPLVTRHGCYDDEQYYTTYQDQTDPAYGTSSWYTTGQLWTYYKQAISHSTLRIYDSDEPSENQLESHQRLFSSSSFFGVKTAAANTISNQGGQLWPKDTVNGYYEPIDLQHWLDSAFWDEQVEVSYSESNSNYNYVVLDLTNCYYSSKCTRHKRHVMWVKRNRLASTWPYYIVIMWDDVNCHIDATKLNATAVWQIQTLVSPAVASAGHYEFTGSNAKLFVKCLSPTTHAHATISGFRDVAGVLYPSSSLRSTDYNDSKDGKIFRFEIYPSVSTETPQFLNVLFPTPLSEQTIPTMSLVDDETWMGVEFLQTGFRALFKKGDSHEAYFASTAPPLPPPTPPAPPTGLTATGGTGQVVLDWDDNGETDLDYYNVYRQTEISEGVYGAWGLIDDAETSTYTDTTVSNGTTYRYYVTAVNTDTYESSASNISEEVTPDSPPPPPPPPPPTPPAYDNRKLSEGMCSWMYDCPVPSGDAVLTEGDLWTWIGEYSGIIADDPPVDISDGGSINCGGTPSSGGGINTADPTAWTGVSIDTANPATPGSGEGIE